MLSATARKCLLVPAAMAVAAGITALPWLIVFRMEGPASNFWGMTAILWAPLALLLGVVAGGALAFRLWPRDAHG